MTPLWTPSTERVSAARLTAFAETVGHEGYEALHRWSVDEPAAFWAAAWDLCGVVGERGDTVVERGASLADARFFPDARLNVVETFLATTGPGDALVEAGEDGRRRTVSWDELRAQVAALAAALGETGVGPGDRVAAWLPEHPRDDRDHAGHGGRRGDLLLHVARLRHRRRPRPLRPDRAHRAGRRRRLRLRREGERLPAPPGRDPRRPPRCPAHDRGPVPRVARARRGPSAWPDVLAAHAGAELSARASSLRPPVVRPLLVGDDGHAEVPSSTARVACCSSTSSSTSSTATSGPATGSSTSRPRAG